MLHLYLHNHRFEMILNDSAIDFDLDWLELDPGLGGPSFEARAEH